MSGQSIDLDAAVDARQQITQARTDLAVMRTLFQAGSLGEEGGRSDVERIRAAEEHLRWLEQSYASRFGRRCQP